MTKLITGYFEWFLFFSLLLTRFIDIATTYFVTPKLILETNPIIRKFKWTSAWLTLVLCLIPFFNTTLGLIVLVMSLLSSSSNIRKVWMMRAIGEERYYKMIKEAISRNNMLKILFFEFVSALFWVCAALLLMVLISFDKTGWGFWFAVGLGAYGMLIFFYYTIYLLKLNKSM